MTLTGKPRNTRKASRNLCHSFPMNIRGCLESGIDRLALKRKHAKNVLMHAPKRLAPYKSLQRFNTQRELAQCKRDFFRKAISFSGYRTDVRFHDMPRSEAWSKNAVASE